MEPWEAVGRKRMDSILADTINDSSFGFTEVATGGANHRGRVKRLEDVEPHGADF